MPERPPLVAFHDVSATYSSASAPTLRHLDLEIRPGEYVVVAGASGSGKTTLVLALNGVLQHVLGAAVEGTALVGGTPVADQRVSDLASTVGILFQEPESQFVSLYVRDEIAFGPENLLLPREEILRRMDEVMGRIGIHDLADRFVYELSGGQKQKVAVAGVLAMQPRLLVLDEPSANLDPSSSREMWELTARLRDEGLAVVVVEKNLDAVLPLADRMVVLDEGRVRFDGPPRDVIAAHGAELLELGIWIPQLAELATVVAGRTGHRTAIVPLDTSEALEAFAGFTITPPSPAALARAASGEPARTPPVEEATAAEATAAAAEASGPSGNATAPLLRASGLKHVYPDGTVALRGVDAEVRTGEIVAICGANGSGKTTLVKHFVGLLKPTDGEVDVFGRRTHDLSVHEIARHVGFVFQDPEHQFVRDTVAEEVRMSLRVGGVPADEQDARIAEILRLLDLVGLDERHPFALSGGQKRRLSVATAVVMRPEVLILDEPTYAQDRRTSVEMMRSILGLVGQAEGGTVPTEARTNAIVLVTHDMRLVADYATRVVVIEGGRVAFDGSPADLFAQPELVARTRLEVPPLTELVQAWRAAGRLTFPVASLAQLAAALR